MSSITGLISAGGGGGGASTNIITDPKKLDKYGISSLYFKNTLSNQTDSRQAIPDNDSDHTAWAGATASDTYVTVLDITSSNGGYLHYVLSCAAKTVGDIVTVRITVDGGTPVELAYEPPTIQTLGEARMFLGSGIVNASFHTSTTVTAAADVWSSYLSYGLNSTVPTRQKASSFDDPANNVYGVGSDIGYLLSDPILRMSSFFQKLEFTSTLKVEAKTSNYTTTQLANFSTCSYTLF